MQEQPTMSTTQYENINRYETFVEQFHRSFPSGQVTRFGTPRSRLMRFQPGKAKLNGT